MEKIMNTCKEHHEKIRNAQKEAALEELLSFRPESEQTYYKRSTRCPECGQMIRIYAKFSIEFTIDGYKF